MPNNLKEKFDKVAKTGDEFLFLETRKERLKKFPFRTLFWALLRRTRFFLINIGLIKKVIGVKIFFGEKFFIPACYALPILQKGFFEGEEMLLTNFIINNLKEGDIFIDGGACFGYYTVLTSKIVGEKGQVHSFEPTPRNFKILSDNASGKNNIFINNKALWDKNGYIDFYDFGEKLDASNTVINDKNETLYYEKLFIENKNLQISKTESIRLDKYCLDLGIKPNFIKIDCEEAEYQILCGAEKILNYHPIFVVEITATEHGISQKLDKITKFLSKYSYRPYRLTNDWNIRPLDHREKFELANVVFIPKK